jgi:hypothetical protein
MSRARHLALAAVLLALGSRAMAAQSAEGAESWRFAFTPYAWISGIRGTIGVGSNTGEVDVAFNEGGEDFEFGFAGLLEARRRRWVARTDFFYVSFSDEQATSADRPVTVGQDDLMLHPEVGYTLLARAWGGVDGLVGARTARWAPTSAISPDRGGGSWPRRMLARAGPISSGSCTVGAGTTSGAAARWWAPGACSISITTGTTCSMTSGSVVLPLG